MITYQEWKEGMNMQYVFDAHSESKNLMKLSALMTFGSSNMGVERFKNLMSQNLYRLHGFHRDNLLNFFQQMTDIINLL